MKYRPRNDNVLVRLTRLDAVRGIVVPEISVHGRQYQVVAVGPKVEGLQEGDWVMMTGQQKVDWDMLPNSADLLVIREANVILVYEPDDVTVVGTDLEEK